MKTTRYLPLYGVFALAGVFAFSPDAALANVTTKLMRTKQQVLQRQAIVDLNRANVTALMSLKGIGKRRAQAIVAYRRQRGSFRTIQELTKVKGISSKRLAQLLKNNPHRLRVRKRA